MKSPIDIMIDSAAFRCTKCGARSGNCGCWTKCSCGWSFEAGGFCRNPQHIFEAVGNDIAARVLDAAEDYRCGRALKDAIHKAAYDAGFEWAKAYHEAETGEGKSNGRK